MEFVEETLLCPITLERMTDPVIAQDGWTYERWAILDHFKKNKKNIRSPMTNLEMDTYLIENRLMASTLKELKNRPITVAKKEPEKDALATEEPVKVQPVTAPLATKQPVREVVRPSLLTPGAKMVMIVKPPKAVKDRLENLQIKYGNLLRTHREVVAENDRLWDRNYDLRCELADRSSQLELNHTIRQLHEQVDRLTIERDNLRAMLNPPAPSRLARRVAGRR